MGWKYLYLISSTYNMFGFNGSLTRLRGEIILEIRVGEFCTLTTFCAVDVISPYTSIVGRSWVHGLKGVALIYHQRLRFPTSDGIAKIIKHSGEAKYCYDMDVWNGDDKVNSPRAWHKRTKKTKIQESTDTYIPEKRSETLKYGDNICFGGIHESL